MLPSREEERATEELKRTIAKISWIAGLIVVFAVGGYFASVRFLKIWDESQLHSAVERGDASEVKALLARGVEVNAKNAVNRDRTPLIEAAAQGHADIVRLLLDRGASPREADTGGRTALMEAVEQGHAEVTRFLLDGGAPADAVDQQGATAFTIATKNGHGQIAKSLLASNPALAATFVQPVQPARPPEHAPIQTRSPELVAKIRATVASYESRIQDAHLYFGAAIPPDKLKTALAAYAPVTEGEEVLALVDNTVFGSAKGLLLTTTSVYSQNHGKPPKSVRLNAIKTIQFEERGYSWSRPSDTIHINGAGFYSNGTVDPRSLALFTEMLAATSRDIKPFDPSGDRSAAEREAVSKVRSIVESYRQRIQDSHVHLITIPADKLQKAIATYAPHRSADEEALALIDNTLFGSATDGLLLTNKCLYSQNAGESPRKLELSSLTLVRFNDGFLNDTIDVNATPFYVNHYVEKMPLSLVAEMLTMIVALNQQ